MQGQTVADGSQSVLTLLMGPLQQTRRLLRGEQQTVQGEQAFLIVLTTRAILNYIPFVRKVKSIDRTLV